MKIRSDFVSNSSSSSFIVISDKGKVSQTVPDQRSNVVLPCSAGEAEFGWQTQRYYHFWSKLNWCAIIVISLYNLEMYESSRETLETQVKKPWFRAVDMEKMLKRVCEEKFNLDVELMSNDDMNDNYFGIDHQSNVGECPENARMFMSEKMLYDFLANDASFIDNSNDNGGRDDDEFDTQTWRPKSLPNDYEK